MSQLSDEDIVKLIIETQDSSLVEVLYKRYSVKIYRKCLTFVKDSLLAEDLTHDIFIKILMNLSKFKHKSKFSTWIYSITYNYCIDFLRKDRKHKFSSLPENETMPLAADDSEDAELKEIESTRLLYLLDQVNTDEKMILIMKYQDGLSIKEIQGVFEVSESAIKMRIKRAKDKMRKLYRENYKDEI